MLPSTSFFKRTTVVEKKKTGAEKTVIDVGGEPFHALAVAFIDNLKNGVSLPEASLKELLSQFFAYFPDYKINQVYLTPLERMRLLINTPRKSEFVECLAYVLRQITIDEILKNPLAYKESLQDLNNESSANLLRAMDTPLPPSALTALAAALKIKLVLSFKELNKELRHRDTYTFAEPESPFKMEIQVQDKRYFPRVKNKDEFTYVGQLAIAGPQPLALGEDENIAKQLKEIAADNDDIWHNYVHNMSILNGLIFDGELTKTKLIDLFIKFLPPSNSELFARLEAKYGKTKIVDLPGKREDEETTMLAEALAKGLSTGHINTDEFFESLDQPLRRHSAPAA